MTRYAVIDPVTGTLIEEYPTATDDEITAAVTVAGERHRTFRFDTTPEDRASLIARVGELHLERREELARIIAQEMGKPIRQAVGEVEFAAAIYQFRPSRSMRSGQRSAKSLTR